MSATKAECWQLLHSFELSCNRISLFSRNRRCLGTTPLTGRKIMFKSFLLKAVSKQLSCHPNVTKQLCHYPFQFHAERGMHSRNKKAMEFIAKGWNALQEVERVIDYCEHNDKRLIPSLRTAKENFELALEADNSNTHARYRFSKLHLKYHVPGDCKAVEAALLVEAAEMGDPEAQFEFGCRLRIELHPGALYLLGAVFLTGDCVKKDVGSALWCFHRASQKGHAGAAIAYGSLLLTGVELPESITRFYVKRGRQAEYLGGMELILSLIRLSWPENNLKLLQKQDATLDLDGYKDLMRK
ncbi:hypothetical protein CQW23_06372 [Capsicum baccatum]|uniref:Uncharacterized protein n=1 Tax=Capsicum baccatum TaxID=33114 RepID=A0A2G2X381_CAPBA|nr:hypothetical protein CQW23_06372 [Capsicum baccatum]